MWTVLIRSWSILNLWGEDCDSTTFGPVAMATSGKQKASNFSMFAPLLQLEKSQIFTRGVFLIRWAKKNRVLRHHYRARKWTFDKNSFLVSSESSIWNGSMGGNRLKKSRCEVGLKCHQSCFAALAFCTKLYISNIGYFSVFVFLIFFSI